MLRTPRSCHIVLSAVSSLMALACGSPFGEDVLLKPEISVLLVNDTETPIHITLNNELPGNSNRIEAKSSRPRDIVVNLGVVLTFEAFRNGESLALVQCPVPSQKIESGYRPLVVYAPLHGLGLEGMACVDW